MNIEKIENCIFEWFGKKQKFIEAYNSLSDDDKSCLVYSILSYQHGMSQNTRDHLYSMTHPELTLDMKNAYRRSKSNLRSICREQSDQIHEKMKIMIEMFEYQQHKDPNYEVITKCIESYFSSDRESFLKFYKSIDKYNRISSLISIFSFYPNWNKQIEGLSEDQFDMLMPDLEGDIKEISHLNIKSNPHWEILIDTICQSALSKFQSLKTF